MNDEEKCSRERETRNFLIRDEESPWNVISFEDLDLNIFAHFFLTLWTFMMNRGRGRGGYGCLVTRHTRNGSELIKTMWFQTLPCSAVKVSCKNMESSQPISLRLLAQARRACLTGTLACQQSPHVTGVSARGRFPFARPSLSLALVNGDECKDWAVANNRSKEIVVV